MKKNLNKLATLALTGVLMTGMSFGALAASTSSGTVGSLIGDTELVLKKEMKIVDVDDAEYSDKVAAPGVTYTYTINPATVDADTVKDGVPVKTGLNGAKIKDDTSTTFAVTDRASSGKLSKDICLDFSNVNWTEPGIYRYELTEGAAASTQVGYSYTNALTSASTTRYVDVYVGYYGENNTLGIIGYVVSYTTDSTKKTDGYEVVENTDGTVTEGAVYSAYDVKVTKYVTGNLGNKNGNFAFTGSVDMANGATYGYAKGTTNVSAKSDGISETLNDSEYFTVKGVPVGHGVTVGEQSYASDGYTTKLKVNGVDDTTYVAGSNVTVNDNANDGVSTAEFTNDRKNTTPTGVVMNIAPYAAMILGAGAFAGVFLGRKKSEDEE